MQIFGLDFWLVLCFLETIYGAATPGLGRQLPSLTFKTVNLSFSVYIPESVSGVYCPDDKILVTVLGTIRKLLPLLFSVDWAMHIYKLLITIHNGQIWFCFASSAYFCLWPSWETKCCHPPFDKWELVHSSFWLLIGKCEIQLLLSVGYVGGSFWVGSS